jgi:uncharacterized membrane protein
MKTIAYILMAIAILAVLAVIFFLFRYFYFSNLSFEAKFLGTIFGLIIFTPILGRFYQVFKER